MAATDFRYEDLLNTKVGKFTPKEVFYKQCKKGKRKKYRGLCDCGHEREVDCWFFRIKNVSSCPVCENKQQKLSRFEIRYKKMDTKKYLEDICDRAREKNRELDITYEFIIELMEKQNFLCNLSGVEISFENSTASLDRIDSDRGYTKDNVQWVHRSINFMKNSLPQKQFLKMCQTVGDYQRKKIEYDLIVQC